MTEDDGATERPPSLADRIAAGLRHGPAWPATYRPALALLAALPATIALLALALAANEARQAAALRQTDAIRIAAVATIRHNFERRRAMAPSLAAPTLTRQLGTIAASLPADATLHAIARGADGILRIEVDCTDPDALLRAFRSRAPWRSVAQSVVEGRGIRVTLEAPAR